MDTYLKLCAGILVSLTLCLILSKFGSSFSVILSVAACILAVIASISFIRPITELFDTLILIGDFDKNLIGALLKTTGIGILTEITATICVDAGNAALGKTLQLVAGFAILWVSIPLYNALLKLVEKILVNV